MTLFSGKELFPPPPLDAPRVLDREPELLTIVNSAVEATLYGFTVPGGTLHKDQAIRFMILADLLNNSGGTPTVTLRAKLGGTTLYQDPTVAISDSANRRGVRADLILAALGSPDAQQLHGWIAVGANAPPGTGDFGNISDDEILGHDVVGAAATENMRADQLFELTAELSTAHANFDVRRLYAYAVLL